MYRPKLIRLTTVPVSMNIIMRGQLAFINNHFEVIGVTSYDEKHFNECGQREGIKMHAIGMARTISLFRDIKSLWQLFRFFRKERPHIVHTHTPKAGLLGMIAAFASHVPVRLHTVGGLPLVEVKGWKRILLNSTERLTYACAHKVYPNSHGLLQIIKKNHFCKENKLLVIANGGTNGVNTDYFDPNYLGNKKITKEKLRHDYGIPNDSIVLCFVGRLSKEKGIKELIESFQTLQNLKKEIDIKLILIGTFEEHYGQLDEQTKDIIVQHKDILNLGRFDDVRPYYLMSDIYAFPSYREGFPNSVLEASAMGLPCIVTNINGCNEIIEDHLNGLIIPVKDSSALTKSLLSLVSDEVERDNLAKNARIVIEQKYKREVVWDGLLKEYMSFV